jgi:hypothetical protein
MIYSSTLSISFSTYFTSFSYIYASSYNAFIKSYSCTIKSSPSFADSVFKSLFIFSFLYFIYSIYPLVASISYSISFLSDADDLSEFASIIFSLCSSYSKSKSIF